MKKLISAVLVLTALFGISADAIEISEDWVNLSAWAYNDVSNFTNEGLLPDCFKGVNDYRVSATRGQFAELAYAVYEAGRDVPIEGDAYALDSDSLAVGTLARLGIIQGYVHTPAYNSSSVVAAPDKKITREEAAVIAVRVSGFLDEYAGYGLNPDEPFTDDADISDYARASVYQLAYSGIISGYSDGSFRPQGEISIEQSISMLYKLYQNMPAASKADGACVNAKEETFLKNFDNGCSETKLKNVLYIKRGDEYLMSFETDMYFRLSCVDYSGKTYILAYNFNKRTEVFDADAKTLLFTIPCYTSGVVDGYIMTRSADRGLYTCGLYDFNGNNVLPNEYSEYEIERLLENNLEPPEADGREADGMVYYAKDSTGRLYSVDTNGENERLICDRVCDGVTYIDGWVYFYDTVQGNRLYAVKSDGSSLQQLSQNKATLLRDANADFSLYDGWVYYLDYDGEYEEVGSYGKVTTTFHDTLWRCKPNENGEMIKEHVYDKPMAYDAYTRQLNGNIYFLDYAEIKEDGGSYLYCFDGESIFPLVDRRCDQYDFCRNADGGGYHFELRSSENLAGGYAINPDGTRYKENFSPYSPDWQSTVNGVYHFDEISDEAYTIGRIGGMVCYFDAEGKQNDVGIEGSHISPIYRYKNCLYFRVNVPSYENSGSSPKRGIYMCDMDAKALVRITDNIASDSFPKSNSDSHMLSYGDSLCYTDIAGNIYGIKLGLAEAVQLYPNGGLLNRGETVKISLDDQNYVVKTDTAGILTRISSNPVRQDTYMDYVKNGDIVGWNY